MEDISFLNIICAERILMDKKVWTKQWKGIASELEVDRLSSMGRANNDSSNATQMMK
jgi:hypothetical protein